MSGSDAIQKELFEEKSLFDVYRKSASYSQNSFDMTIEIVSGVTLIAISLYVALFHREFFRFSVSAINDWLNLGFTYSVTILGFLVAGFTIFSTMTRTEIFIALAACKHKTIDTSQLKFVFYSFLRVFILHIALLFLCVIVTMLRDTSRIYLGVLSRSSDATLIKEIFVTLLVPVTGYLIISSLLHLKTFVWNLYQSIIIAVAGAAALYELEQASRSRPNSRS